MFEGNRIDIRGGRRSDSFVLAGNHFGTRVVNNHLLGGGLAFRMMACPTEHPMIWGWSHAPFLGGVVEGNVLEDCEQGGIVGVEHRGHQDEPGANLHERRAPQQRRAMVRAVPGADGAVDAKKPLAGLTVGYQPSQDPASSS